MGLTFDGIDIEKTYGIIVDGASSWPKPERDMEMIHIPGRNGDLMMDNGCWHNVEISYNLLIKDDWETKFEEFADWLCSHVGYFRLEDQERHPGVYRMAEFSGPIDPELWFTTDTGVFEIVFNCKPQQFYSGQFESYGATRVLLNYDSDYSAIDSSDSYYNKTAVTPLFAAKAGDTIGLRYTVPGAVTADIYFSVFSVVDGVATLVKTKKFATSISTENKESTYTLTESDLTVSNVVYGWISICVRCSFIGTQNAQYLFITLNNLNFRTQSGGLQNTVAYTGFNIENPTRYPSRPIIMTGSILLINRTNGQNYYTIDMGFYTMGPDEIGDFAYIDAELEDCYTIIDGQSININSGVTITYQTGGGIDDFPTLEIGTSAISFAFAYPTLEDFKTSKAYTTIITRLFRI